MIFSKDWGGILRNAALILYLLENGFWELGRRGTGLAKKRRQIMEIPL